MGLIVSELPLTVVNPELEAKRRQTAPGMAHWSDPSTKRSCRECVFWTGCGRETGYYAARKSGGGGTLKPRSCDKYRQLMRGDIGPAIHHYMPSCKYFEASENPPPVQQK